MSILQNVRCRSTRQRFLFPRTTWDPDDPDVFHILLCLVDEGKHGYSVMLEIDQRTHGNLRLRPGSLCWPLNRLPEAALSRKWKPHAIPTRPVSVAAAARAAIQAVDPNMPVRGRNRIPAIPVIAVSKFPR